MAIMGLVIGVIVVVAAVAIWSLYFRPTPPLEVASKEKMAFPLPDKPSIAVLPFVNMSGDKEQEFFSDGITENIITGLSKISALFVIARNSSFTYKGKPVMVRQVAEDLGVRYVLEGSVQRSGDRVRITAQFIDALKGHHLWSERYDRDPKDLFAIEDDITKKIITALQVMLTQGEQAILRGKGTENLDAYLKCMEAGEYLLRMNKDANLMARQRAEEAIALDSKHSSAHAILGKTHIQDIIFNWSASPRESMGRAFESAKKALSLDDSNFEARVVLAWIYLLKREHDKGIEECEGAVSLAPSAAHAAYAFGIILRFAGRVKDAIPMLERAIRLNPIPQAAYLCQLGLSYTFIGEFEKAIGICKKGLSKNPDDLVGRIALVVAYTSLGRESDAGAEVAELLRIDPKFSLEYAAKTWPYKREADRDFVLTALRKAGLK
jgi:adenylate cyclase